MNNPIVQLQELELSGGNPAKFSDVMNWRMRVEVLDKLTEPISVSIVWVGSANSNNYDQVLDEFDVGPFPVGTSEFNLACDAPIISRIPMDELLGVTVMYFIYSYKGNAFLRVGYYVQVAYIDDVLNANPPADIDLNMLGRCLAMTQPAITTIPIMWDEVASGELDE